MRPRDRFGLATPDLTIYRYFDRFPSVFDRKWLKLWEKVELQPRDQLEFDTPALQAQNNYITYIISLNICYQISSESKNLLFTKSKKINVEKIAEKIGTLFISIFQKKKKTFQLFLKLFLEFQSSIFLFIFMHLLHHLFILGFLCVSLCKWEPKIFKKKYSKAPPLLKTFHMN